MMGLVRASPRLLAGHLKEREGRRGKDDDDGEGKETGERERESEGVRLGGLDTVGLPTRGGHYASKGDRWRLFVA